MTDTKKKEMRQIEKDDTKVSERGNVNGPVGIEQHAARLCRSGEEGSVIQVVKRWQLRLLISYTLWKTGVM